MGKGSASEIRPVGRERWEPYGGAERTLDPVTERFPAWPSEESAEWRGFPAAPAFASAVRRLVQGTAIDRMICPEDTADIVLAASEAFANAVRHGESGPGDAIWICQQWRPGEVTIRLRYRGAPFPVESLELPTPDATSGRGRYIMSRLLDQVEYRFRGGWTEVTLARRLRRAEPVAFPG